MVVSNHWSRAAMGFMMLRNVGHRPPILMIAVLGAALSIMSWFIVSSLEDRTSAAEFNLRATNWAAAPSEWRK
jgi:hypothetical protein